MIDSNESILAKAKFMISLKEDVHGDKVDFLAKSIHEREDRKKKIDLVDDTHLQRKTLVDKAAIGIFNFSVKSSTLLHVG